MAVWLWWLMNVTLNLVLWNRNVSPYEHISFYRRLALLHKQSMSDQNAETRISGWEQHANIRILGRTSWSGKNLCLFTIEGNLFCHKFHFLFKNFVSYFCRSKIVKKCQHFMVQWVLVQVPIPMGWRFQIVLLTLSDAAGLLFADISEKTVQPLAEKIYIYTSKMGSRCPK